MKILITGSFTKGALLNYYLDDLSTNIDMVETFPSLDVFMDFYYKNIFNKLYFRSGLSKIYKTINQKLLKKIEIYKPDIVWIIRGTEILPSTLIKIKSKGIKLVNFNPDHPFIFEGIGGGNQNITDSIGLYDLHLSYANSIIKKIKNEYQIPVQRIPFGYGIKLEEYNQLDKTLEYQRACFIGKADRKRAKSIQFLLKGGLEIDVYGDDWNWYFKNQKNIKVYKAVYEKDFWQTLRMYRVQLNLLREHNKDNHNMRTFEIPAVGGIMLSQYTQEQDSFFKKNETAFYYKNMEACLQNAKNILNLQKTKANNIRLAARRQSVEGGYTYTKRAETVVQIFKALLRE